MLKKNIQFIYIPDFCWQDSTTIEMESTEGKCGVINIAKFRGIRQSGPSKSTLQRSVAKFEPTGSVKNHPTLIREHQRYP